MMATNIGLNFAKQKVVVEILDVKESQKWSAQNAM